MIQINSSFNPFRMKLGRKEPIAFTVEVENTEAESKMLTMNIRLSGQLSFEKGGYKTEQMERVQELGPGEKKKFYYTIFQKAGTRTGQQPVLVKVLEHYRSFNYVANEYSKRLVLKVEE